jgi:hypothetical protein
MVRSKAWPHHAGTLARLLHLGRKRVTDPRDDRALTDLVVF